MRSACPGSAQGKRTRGKTAPGRLAALDAFLLWAEGPLLARQDEAWQGAAFVDLGFGERPLTTLESAAAFGAVNPALQTVGVDIDPARVEAARPLERPGLRFAQGGFSGADAAPARLVRAMNVLRQYAPWEVAAAHARMGAALVEGGLLVEGSTDRAGGRLCAHLLRRTPEGLRREGLLFYTAFARGFAPMQLRDYLPRDLRRAVVPGAPIAAFFDDWTAAWVEARAEGAVAPPAAFARAAALLARRRAGIGEDPWLRSRGYLWWRPPEGVPAGEELRA